MAIVQISQITQRKGLQADLPNPLAGAELGWSTDTRQLWIGNGTLADGAPVVGNTEILTEFSDILNLNAIYTYKGEAAGYVVQTGPTTNSPVTQNLQTWLDQFASVKDFGAVGDGVTDDTDAINRALAQLYCNNTPSLNAEQNVPARRVLFFPAGTYLVSDTILIPTYATLVGEGADSSVITLASVATTITYVARTADSLQQIDVNIGSGGAQDPGYVTISNMGFFSQVATSNVFLVEDANNCDFTNVTFKGSASSYSGLGDEVSSVEFSTTSAAYYNHTINFINCEFTQSTWGIYNNAQTKGVTVSSSAFGSLYRGIQLDDPVAPLTPGTLTGVRITQNTLDNIFDAGIFVNSGVSYCASASNAFYNVANQLSAATPVNSQIVFNSENNVSIGDLFLQPATNQTQYPCVSITGQSISTTNGTQLQLGSYITQTGNVATVAPAAVNTTIVTVNGSTFQGMTLNYSGQTNWTGNNVTRVGSVRVAAPSSQSGSVFLEYVDDYTENYLTTIVFTATQGVDGNVTIQCTNPGANSFVVQYTTSYFAS